MLHLACKIPHDTVIACSGGPDSMALLSFCQAGKKHITVLHIDHGTAHAKEARKFVETYCKNNSLPLVISEVPKSMEHSENAWREFRLGAYREFTKTNQWVATAHHLDDAIEWYLMTALHGGPKFMQPLDTEHKLMKPFLHTEKDQLIKWCNDKNVPYVIDPTNIGQENTRAILRESVMPGLLKIHPGMKSSIKNKMIGLNE
jgi:tRNA(Ile)-lysidine synthase